MSKSSPGCSFVWVLRIPVKHSCLCNKFLYVDATKEAVANGQLGNVGTDSIRQWRSGRLSWQAPLSPPPFCVRHAHFLCRCIVRMRLTDRKLPQQTWRTRNTERKTVYKAVWPRVGPASWKWGRGSGNTIHAPPTGRCTWYLHQCLPSRSSADKILECFLEVSGSRNGDGKRIVGCFLYLCGEEHLMVALKCKPNKMGNSKCVYYHPASLNIVHSCLPNSISMFGVFPPLRVHSPEPTIASIRPLGCFNCLSCLHRHKCLLFNRTSRVFLLLL